DREGEWVKGLLLKDAEAGVGGDLNAYALVARHGGSLGLVEHGPSDGCDDKAAADLNDGQRDAEEVEDRGAEQVDDGEEDDVVDGDPACEHAIDLRGDVADEAEEDDCGAEWVD